MPIYRGTGGSTPLNDNVTEDEVGLLLSRFDALASELEQQTGIVATDLAQAVTAANQAATDATQQKLFSQAAAQEASGYAVEAFFARDAAQLSETNAAQSAAEAAASAASVDAANLARVDQSNTFAGSQTISKDSGDVGLIIEADTDNDTESDNAFIELRQDGSFTKAGFELDSTNSTVLSSFKQGGTSPFNPIILRQDNSDTQNKSLVLDAFGRLGLNTGNPTARLTIRGDLQASVDPESEMSVERLASFMARSTTGRTQAQLSIVSPESNVVAITSGENDTLKLGTNNPNDDSAFNEVMLLTTQGDVGIGTENPTSKLHVGGDLTVDGNIINAGLPVTETGTWTPVLVQSNGSSIAVDTPTTTGVYTKVGKLVTVSFQYSVGSWVEGAGINKITGLPFPANSTFKGSNAFFSSKVSLHDSAVIGLTIPDSSDIVLRTMRSNNSGTAPVTGTDDSLVPLTMQGTLTYETN